VLKCYGSVGQVNSRDLRVNGLPMIATRLGAAPAAVVVNGCWLSASASEAHNTSIIRHDTKRWGRPLMGQLPGGMFLGFARNT
jgi:hypothetical protein